MMKRISIITGSSNSGNGCLKALFNDFKKEIDSGKLEITAAYRTEAKAKDHIKLYGSKLKTVYGVDADKPETLAPALKGMDAAMIVTPLDHAVGFNGDSNRVLNMMKAATQHKVGHIVYVASFTVNAVKELAPISTRFIDGENLLDSYVGDASKPNWTVLRGGVFMINYLDMLKLDEIVMPRIGLPLIDPEDIGRLGAFVMAEGKKHFQKKYEVSGKEFVNPEQMAKEFSKIKGKPVAYKDVKVTDYLEMMMKTTPPPLQACFKFMWSNPGVVPYSNCVEDITGKANTFGEFLQREVGKKV